VITKDQIPKEAIRAALLEWFGDPGDAENKIYIRDMSEALAAGLAAWPGAMHDLDHRSGADKRTLILPLQEKTNDA
jgi:hypothetical protein